MGHRTPRDLETLSEVDLAHAILEEIDEVGRMMWTERVRGPRAGMVIQKIMMVRAHAWVWHKEPKGRQPTHHHSNH